MITKKIYMNKDMIIADYRFIGILLYRKMATRECVARGGMDLKPL